MAPRKKVKKNNNSTAAPKPKKGDVLQEKLKEGGIEKAKNNEEKLKCINDVLKMPPKRSQLEQGRKKNQRFGTEKGVRKAKKHFKFSHGEKKRMA